MPIHHAFESEAADSGDDTLVRPSDWNANHVVLGDFLHSQKASADTLDDEFPSSTLDAKWTVVSGASGTVDLNSTSGSPIYDLTTRPGWLLMQGGESSGEHVRLRQDTALPDGSSLVVACTLNMALEATPGGNEIWIGMGINDNDTDEGSGDDFRILMDTEASATAYAPIISYDGSAILGTSGQSPVGRVVFLRITRVGLVMRAFFSYDGTAWAFLDGKTLSNAPTNIWLYTLIQATNALRPIVGFKWVRQGTNDLDPWPWW